MVTGPFLGVKRPGCGVDHPPPSSAEVKERVELYPLLPHWAFVACSRVNFRSNSLKECPIKRGTVESHHKKYSIVVWLTPALSILRFFVCVLRSSFVPHFDPATILLIFLTQGQSISHTVSIFITQHVFSS